VGAFWLLLAAELVGPVRHVHIDASPDAPIEAPAAGRHSKQNPSRQACAGREGCGAGAVGEGGVGGQGGVARAGRQGGSSAVRALAGCKSYAESSETKGAAQSHWAAFSS
jgi:hypothetical protein